MEIQSATAGGQKRSIDSETNSSSSKKPRTKEQSLFSASIHSNAAFKNLTGRAQNLSTSSHHVSSKPMEEEDSWKISDHKLDVRRTPERILLLAKGVANFLWENGFTTFSNEDENLDVFFDHLAKTKEFAFARDLPITIHHYYKYFILPRLEGLSLSSTEEEIKQKLQEKPKECHWSFELDLLLIHAIQKSGIKGFSARKPHGFFKVLTQNSPELSHFTPAQVTDHWNKALAGKLKELTVRSSIEEIEKALQAQTKAPSAEWSFELDLLLIQAVKNSRIKDFSAEKPRGFFQALIQNTPELSHFTPHQVKDHWNKALSGKLKELTVHSSIEEIEKALQVQIKAPSAEWSSELDLLLIHAIQKSGIKDFSAEKPRGFFQALIQNTPELSRFTPPQVKNHWNQVLAPKLKELTIHSSTEEIKETLKAPSAEWSFELDLLLIQAVQNSRIEDFSAEKPQGFFPTLIQNTPELALFTPLQITNHWNQVLAPKLKELTIHSFIEEIEKALKNANQK
jgi:predicted secreted Zn-dependent protease